jgi:hypothetical protein
VLASTNADRPRMGVVCSNLIVRAEFVATGLALAARLPFRNCFGIPCNGACSNRYWGRKVSAFDGFVNPTPGEANGDLDLLQSKEGTYFCGHVCFPANRPGAPCFFKGPFAQCWNTAEHLMPLWSAVSRRMASYDVRSAPALAFQTSPYRECGEVVRLTFRADRFDLQPQCNQGNDAGVHPQLSFQSSVACQPTSPR